MFAAQAALASVAPPKVHVQSLNDLPVVVMTPYDEKANADAAVNAAFARAKKDGKRVLIDLGGNWCTDCIVLANVLELPEIKTFVDAHYEVVSVDIGRYDRNLQIQKRFGLDKRLDGVPSILIANPDGTLVNRGHTAALIDARNVTPQGIANWLAQWVK
jgi:thiol-disulfide isomerase/thioredoxin